MSGLWQLLRRLDDKYLATFAPRLDRIARLDRVGQARGTMARSLGARPQIRRVMGGLALVLLAAAIGLLLVGPK